MENSEGWIVYEGNEGPGGRETHRACQRRRRISILKKPSHCSPKFYLSITGSNARCLSQSIRKTGEINPEEQTNIPGLHNLETADMMVLFTRFRELPDEQMKYIVDYTNSGKPVMGFADGNTHFQLQ